MLKETRFLRLVAKGGAAHPLPTCCCSDNPACAPPPRAPAPIPAPAIHSAELFSVPMTRYRSRGGWGRHRTTSFTRSASASPICALTPSMQELLRRYPRRRRPGSVCGLVRLRCRRWSGSRTSPWAAASTGSRSASTNRVTGPIYGWCAAHSGTS